MDNMHFAKPVQKMIAVYNILRSMVKNGFEEVKLIGLGEDHTFSYLVDWHGNTESQRTLPDNRNHIS